MYRYCRNFSEARVDSTVRTVVGYVNLKFEDRLGNTRWSHFLGIVPNYLCCGSGSLWSTLILVGWIHIWAIMF
jgi:hypothetical protein